MALVVLAGCRKEGCTDESALNFDSDAKKDDGSCNYAPLTTSVQFHLQAKVGAEDFAYDQEYADAGGRKYKFSRAQFYLSMIRFLNNDGLVNASNNVLLVDPTVEMYDLGAVTPGQYTNINMRVGVEGDLNHTDPATYPSTSPLSPQNPSMHWSWNSGYKFIVLEGMADTTLNANGAVDAPFVFHVGLDEMLKALVLPADIDAQVDGSATINIQVDYGKFFEGIDLRTENSSHTGGDAEKAISRKLSDNSATLFTVQ